MTLFFVEILGVQRLKVESVAVDTSYRQMPRGRLSCAPWWAAGGSIADRTSIVMAITFSVARLMASLDTPFGLGWVHVRLLSSQACLRGIQVFRLVCRRFGVGLSVVSGSWIASVPC